VLVSGTTLTPRPAVCNVGVRPTIGGARLLVEVHIPGFRGNLYGRTLTVEFVSPIRTEKKFSSVADLRRQIARDVASLTQARPPATMNA
jgi:riboflavin kinase/FMN adenylyltransferase